MINFKILLITKQDLKKNQHSKTTKNKTRQGQIFLCLSKTCYVQIKRENKKDDFVLSLLDP